MSIVVHLGKAEKENTPPGSAFQKRILIAKSILLIVHIRNSRWKKSLTRISLNPQINYSPSQNRPYLRQQGYKSIYII